MLSDKTKKASGSNADLEQVSLESPGWEDGNAIRSYHYARALPGQKAKPCILTDCYGNRLMELSMRLLSKTVTVKWDLNSFNGFFSEERRTANSTALT